MPPTATAEQLISVEWLPLLRHAVGARPESLQRNHGKRNNYCAELDSEEHRLFVEMTAAGYARAGCLINNGRDRYFHVTRAGCKLIGLSQAATERAINPN